MSLRLSVLLPPIMECLSRLLSASWSICCWHPSTRAIVLMECHFNDTPAAITFLAQVSCERLPQVTVWIGPKLQSFGCCTGHDSPGICLRVAPCVWALILLSLVSSSICV